VGKDIKVADFHLGRSRSEDRLEGRQRIKNNKNKRLVRDVEECKRSKKTVKKEASRWPPVEKGEMRLKRRDSKQPERKRCFLDHTVSLSDDSEIDGGGIL